MRAPPSCLAGHTGWGALTQGAETGQHHGPWGIAESGVTNQKAGGTWERKITQEQTNKSCGGNQTGGGGLRAAAAHGQRPHTVDTSVPLPL